MTEKKDSWFKQHSESIGNVVILLGFMTLFHWNLNERLISLDNRLVNIQKDISSLKTDFAVIKTVFVIKGIYLNKLVKNDEAKSSL